VKKLKFKVRDNEGRVTVPDSLRKALSERILPSFVAISLFFLPILPKIYSREN
jgi:DNA-binding transcriptional regulator/RsmH inhibitor MraZ